MDLSLVRHALRQTPTERLRAWRSIVDVVRSARTIEKAPALVAVRKLGRRKDRLVLLQLEATLKERKSGG